MSMINTWSNLACPCGSEKFIRLIALRWTDGSGTVEVPSAFRCAGCGQEVDAAKLIGELKLKQKRKELSNLTEELGAQTPPAVPTPVVK